MIITRTIHYTGVEQNGNYAVGSNPFCPTTILLNHVGLPPKGRKACVIVNPPASEFVLMRVLPDATLREVFRGALHAGGTELGPGQTGDFSMVTTEGIYQIFCGPCYSRRFAIHQKIYDIPMRLMVNFFQMQRCGDTHLGYAGPCHRDDGRMAESGEHRDFSGGYHESSDLRKWHMFLNLAHIGLVQFALRYHGHWDTGLVADEIRWGSDYYHKIIKDDGGIYDSVWIPPGWGPRDYYESDAPAPAHWYTVRDQALTACYFRQRDPVYSQKCLDMALRVWQHMTRSDRPAHLYHAPALPPRGHDGWSDLFSGFYPGSALDTAQQVCAAAELYRATGDTVFPGYVARGATALVNLQIGAENQTDALGNGCFREGPQRMCLADAHRVFWSTSGPLALCEALEVAPDHAEAPRWREAARRIAEQCRRIAGRNLYSRIPALWWNSEDGSDKPPFGYMDGGKGHSVGPDSSLLYYYNSYTCSIDILALAGFLRRAAAVFNELEYAALAQRQVDWLLGYNPFDKSFVEGVGYNQLEHARGEETMRHIPQMPGAVNTGTDAEYDLPPAGLLLWALAELSDI